nr:endosialidase [uncultured Mediterranean phage uvMED]
MANTVNVTTANTFEQWRVKTNELGTKIGDLDEVTNSDIGGTTIVNALKAHQGVVAGSVTTTGATMTGSMIFNDNAKVILGTSSDGLEIYHDGSHSYIADTGTGNLKFTAPTAEFSANVDVAGTLSLNGTAIGESIADTVGAMVGSNTETGIAVTYDDSDNTLDFVLGTSQTSITSLKNAALAIGRDADNEINFATDNNIIFRAAGANELKLVTAALHPITDSDLDLGTTALRFKDTFTDTITVTGAVTADSLDIEGNVDINGTLEADAITVGGVTLNSTIGVAVGAMVGGNTESGIAVTYQASDNTLDFDVNDPVITLTGAVTGSATMTNLGSVTIDTTSGVANVVEADIANDAVSRAKLKDEVSLLIINAAGSTVKTIFGAGS